MIRKFIASQFKRPSLLFGNFASSIMVKNNQRNYDRLIRDLNVQPQNKLLEIGYGPGIGIHMLANLCSTCIIHGIDFSKLMFNRATKYNKSFIDSTKVCLQYGDFLKASNLDDDYDKVFCLNVIYFWDDLRIAFRKVLSILKNGGAFHIYMADKTTLIKMKTPDAVFNKYSIEEITESLISVGFGNVEHYSDKGLYIKATK